MSGSTGFSNYHRHVAPLMPEEFTAPNNGSGLLPSLLVHCSRAEGEAYVLVCTSWQGQPAESSSPGQMVRPHRSGVPAPGQVSGSCLAPAWRWRDMPCFGFFQRRSCLKIGHLQPQDRARAPTLIWGSVGREPSEQQPLSQSPSPLSHPALWELVGA